MIQFLIAGLSVKQRTMENVKNRNEGASVLLLSRLYQNPDAVSQQT